jgi:restriction system protein
MTTSPPGSDGPNSFPPPKSKLSFVEQWFTEEPRPTQPPEGVLKMRGYAPTIVQSDRNQPLFDPPPPKPELMLQAAVTFGSKTDEGLIVEAVGIPWRALLLYLTANPHALHDFHWRDVEELVAAAYKDSGYDDVILTPRSGDRGRDVIAVKRDIVTVRVFDQVKAYSPNSLVERNDVDAMLGVLTRDQNVSLGVVTTTSDFAPGVYTDADIKRFMPHRLDLRPRTRLLEMLGQLAKG